MYDISVGFGPRSVGNQGLGLAGHAFVCDVLERSVSFVFFLRDRDKRKDGRILKEVGMSRKRPTGSRIVLDDGSIGAGRMCCPPSLAF